MKEWRGSLEEAGAHWPQGTAVGKAGIAEAEGRDPRLVLDSTVTGVNPAVRISEHVTNPSILDMMATMEEDATDLHTPPYTGCILDVKAAHKRHAP